MDSATAPFLSEFQRRAAGAPRAVPWLRELKVRAATRLSSLAIPSTGEEDWRYTNVSPWLAKQFEHAHVASSAPAPVPLLGAGAPQLVFVDGRFVGELSALGNLPAGVFVGSYAAAQERVPELLEPHLTRHSGVERHAFLAMNAALSEDGGCVLLPAGIKLDRPLELVFVRTSAPLPRATHVRNLIVLGEHAHATVIERYVGPRQGAGFTNAVTELVVGQEASLAHVKVQREGADTLHVASVVAKQEAGSSLSSWSFALGGALARTELHTRLAGRGARALLSGLYLPQGQQLVDHHTFVDHAVPGCESRQLFKGVLGGAARGVFNGKILVRRDAQRTVAFQRNNNLILTEGAVVDTRPQLEIYADDVKCSHGATVGAVDPEVLFYLRSRGLSASQARHLVTVAFAGEVASELPSEGLRAALDIAVGEALAEMSGL